MCKHNEEDKQSKGNNYALEYKRFVSLIAIEKDAETEDAYSRNETIIRPIHRHQ